MKYLEWEETEIPTGRILTIFLNNPETKNSMNSDMGLEFETLIQSLANAKDLPRAVILSGRNGVFSAGGDLNLLKSFARRTFEENREGMQKFYNSFLSIRRLPVPVIGAVSGHAVGAGLALALACDLRVFANEGKYSFNFVKLGIHPGMGSSYLAVELLGKSLANRLLFLAETFNGNQAMDMGLCEYSVPQSEVLGKALEIAASIGNYAPLALKELKANIYSDANLKEAIQKEAESQARNFLSEDFQETIRSIEEKRKPIFRGI